MDPIFSEPPHLRAADADRERMAAFLSRHCGEGRLSPEELSARLDRVYCAVTYGELERLGSDLPVERPARPQRRRLLVPLVTAATLLVVALGTVGLLEALASSPAATLLVLCLLVLLGLLVASALVSAAVSAAPFVALIAGGALIVRRLRSDRRPRLTRAPRPL